MTETVAHIVGMNNLIKEEFLRYMSDKHPDIIIQDLDKITNKIRTRPQMHQTKNKTDINRYWKEALNRELDKIYQDSRGKKIVFLGLSTFHRNHRVRVNIPTSSKYFVDVNPVPNAKDIVKYNLDKYRTNIIDGSFPLRYLDHQFLTKQRLKLLDVYEKMGYTLKTPKALIGWMDVRLRQGGGSKNQVQNPVDGLFVGSITKYESIIKRKRKKRNRRQQDLDQMLGISGGSSTEDDIIGYNEEWLAVLGSVPDINMHVKKGYNERKRGKQVIQEPFVEEQYPGALENLNRPCTVYVVSKDGFDKVKWYKYKNADSAKILSQRNVKNIVDYLQDMGIKVVKKRS